MKANPSPGVIAGLALVIACGGGWYWIVHAPRPRIEPTDKPVFAQEHAVNQNDAVSITALAPIPEPDRESFPLPVAVPSVGSIPAVRIDDTLLLPTNEEEWDRAVAGITVEQEIARQRREVARVVLAQVQSLAENAPLSSEGRKRLQQLLVNKEMSDSDVSIAAHKHGITWKDLRLKALQEAERTKIDNEIRALVGDEYFATIKARWGKFEDRLYAVEFVGEAYQRGMPLSQTQRKIVSGVLTQLDAGNAQRWIGSPLDPGSGLRAYDKQALAELQGVLSPEQLEIVRHVRIDTNLFRAAKELKRSQAATSGASAKKPQ